MLASVGIVFAVLFAVGLAAGVRCYYLLSRRLARIERLQHELNEAVSQIAQKADIQLRPEGDLPTPFPAPLRLRRPDLSPRPLGEGVEHEDFRAFLRRTFLSFNLPAAGVVLAVILAFAFFLGMRRDRPAEANGRRAEAEAPAAPAPRPVRTEKPLEPAKPPEAPPAPAAAAPVPAAPAPAAPAPGPRVAFEKTALRAAPGEGAPVLADIPELARVTVLGAPAAAPGWVEIEWEGRRGFARSDVLAEAEPAFP